MEGLLIKNRMAYVGEDPKGLGCFGGSFRTQDLAGLPGREARGPSLELGPSRRREGHRGSFQSPGRLFAEER